jgi:hypothetical protein
VPDLPAGGGEQRELLARLRAVIEAKDTEIGVLRSGLDAERELRHCPPSSDASSRHPVNGHSASLRALPAART